MKLIRVMSILAISMTWVIGVQIVKLINLESTSLIMGYGCLVAWAAQIISDKIEE